MTKTKKDHKLKGRSAFSLIELIIVFILIVAVASTTATRIYQSSGVKQFDASKKAIQGHILLAKRLAHVMNSEATVVISKTDNRYYISLNSPSFSDRLKKKFAIKRALPGIQEVHLEDPSSVENPEEIAVPMLGYGPIKTDLVLTCKGMQQEMQIVLNDFFDDIKGSDDDAKSLYPESAA